MCIKAALGAILVLCSTTGAAWSAPISYVVDPGSGTLTVGDTVTVTFTFDPSELSFPPGTESLVYGAGVNFDDRYFAFTSRTGAPTLDPGDAIFVDVGTFGAHKAYSLFQYTDVAAYKDPFSYTEIFTAIGGTPETDVLTAFQPGAAAYYIVEGRMTNLVNVGVPEYYDVTPHVPEPSSLALSALAVAALSARRTRRNRRT